MKVLISAYACEPGQGSEPGAGWEWSRAAALENEVWLLTRENNAQKIEAALREEPHLKLHPVYIDLPKWARFWKRGNRGIRAYYLLWQLLVWRTGSALHKHVKFDLAHHLTLGIDWLPTGLALIRDLKFIWGPVGGTSHSNWRLWRFFGLRGIGRELVREIATRPCRRLMGEWTARRAHLVLAQNRDVLRRFRGINITVLEPHVALNPLDLRESVGPRQSHQLVFAGRILTWKGLLMAISALRHPECEGMSLDIYGQGPDRHGAVTWARRMGVSHRIRFLGQRPREEVIRVLSSATALVFPSLHDSAGWIVAEAICTGCPVVCFDVGGPGVLTELDEKSRAMQISRFPDIAIAKAVAELRARTSEETSECYFTRDRLPSILRNFYRTEPVT